MSVRITDMLIRELDTPPDARFYWMDSTTVLKYLANEKARYKIFVANRVQTIRDSTDPDEWYYVDSVRNPTDDASRGVKMSSFVEKATWLNAPSFLWSSMDEWPQIPTDIPSNILDVPEIITSSSNATITSERNDIQRFTRFSNWYLLKKVIAWLLRLRKRSSPMHRMKDRTQPCPIEVNEMERAEVTILKIMQTDSFSVEINVLKAIDRGDHQNERQFIRKKKMEIKKTSSEGDYVDVMK